ncbi:MAG: hypothetical protein QM791_03990 [Ferruginibacter sp.]
MKKDLLFIILAIFQLCALLMPALFPMYKNIGKNGEHKITPYGKWFYLIGFIGLVFTIWFYKVTNDQADIDNKELQSEIEKRVKKQTDRMYAGLSEALAKEHLKYDTLEKMFVFLRDSSKPIVVPVSPLPPLPKIMLYEKGIRHSILDDRIKIFLQLEAKESACKIYSIKVFNEYEWNSKIVNSKEPFKIYNGPSIIPVNDALIVSFNIFEKRLDKINIALLIQYSGERDNKIHHFKEVYKYDLRNPINSIMFPDFRDSFLKKYNLY